MNDFGYIAAAKGDLQVGDRAADGQFPVTGSLHLAYRLFGDPETVKNVQVQGTIDGLGRAVSLTVVSATAGIESAYLILAPPHSTSTVDGPGGSPSYQTDCTASTASLPQGSDLVPDGTMSFTNKADGTGTIVKVFVRNVGNLPARNASSSPGRMRIGTTIVDASLGNLGGTQPTDVIHPGERGTVETTVPAGEITRCVTKQVDIDVDHRFQSGDPDPFGNDTATVSTPCVRWSTRLTADLLEPPLVLDSFLEGKSLLGIVSSAQLGRKQDIGAFLCSHCHHTPPTPALYGGSYLPPIGPDGTPDPHDGSGYIQPTDLVGGTSWASPGGWGNRFMGVASKPNYLKDVVQQWLADGKLP